MVGLTMMGMVMVTKTTIEMMIVVRMMMPMMMGEVIVTTIMMKMRMRLVMPRRPQRWCHELSVNLPHEHPDRGNNHLSLRGGKKVRENLYVQ